MDRRGRLETRAALWTLLAGVPAFVLSALAMPVLLAWAVLRTMMYLRWHVTQDILVALWAVAGALVLLRALLISVEALGQLWWRRLLQALALPALVAILCPLWWVSRG